VFNCQGIKTIIILSENSYTHIDTRASAKKGEEGEAEQV